MERLTKRYTNAMFGAYMACSVDCINEDFDCNDCVKLDEIVDRLAAYEDTGLTPEEIMAFIPPPNDPLTLEELREMGQKCEAVYVTHTDGLPVFRDQKYCAAVLDFSPAFGSTVMHVHAIYGDRLTMWEDEYGKTWLAYRRRPEEGTL